MDVRAGQKRRLSIEELMLLNCGVREDLTLERRSKQSILKEINPEYSLWGMMLKLKLQYFGHLIGRADSLAKTLTLTKIEGGRIREWQRMRQHHCLNGHESEQAPGDGEGQGSLASCSPWSHTQSDTTEQQNNWSLLLWAYIIWCLGKQRSGK